jgi:uncharacterized protein YndB with AHSA1/START domain
MSNPTTITATPGTPYVDIVREFDAPVEAVFRAHVARELYEQWIGSAGDGIEVTEYDAAPGGTWKYVIKGPVNNARAAGGDNTAGEIMSFRGVFHTVEQNRLLVQTFEVSFAPNQVGVDTTTFEDLGGGRSRLTLHELYPSIEARDAAMASGMESGIRAGYDRLEEIAVA